MRKSLHSEEKIIAAVKQLEAGRSVKELAREMGVTDQTLYNWKSKYGGMEVSDAKRLRQLEREPSHMRRLAARHRSLNRGIRFRCRQQQLPAIFVLELPRHRLARQHGAEIR